jgi:hypothetical protein
MQTVVGTVTTNVPFPLWLQIAITLAASALIAGIVYGVTRFVRYVRNR